MTIDGQQRLDPAPRTGSDRHPAPQRRRAADLLARLPRGQSHDGASTAGHQPYPVELAPFSQDADRRPALERPAATLIMLVGLVGVSFALRVGELGSWLWMDEGISVGIASHRLTEIPSTTCCSTGGSDSSAPRRPQPTGCR
jgi:hypothetical protein